MTRTKRGSIAKKRRKSILSLNKGFRGSHSKLFRTANQQYMKSLRYSYIDRKIKKRDFRSLWIKRINCTVRRYGLRYNLFINQLKLSRILINRKILAKLVQLESKTLFVY
uniref:Large ribosomal subunit protein bL20c n=1 Tax=Euglenaformis proxima TaxID=299110 RepID=A0A023HHX4_9EUGL|nr:ribosomal protein L20 [Euglenaformis proxima]AGL11988.1 ribosomal protein L20 [Euglenaformis proxima]